MTITAQTPDASIAAEVLDGTWETYGVDRAVKVDPETLVTSFNEWGCDKASFVLKRNPWAAWPDLAPYTPIEVYVGGVLVWEGRTNGTPIKAGAEQQISVQCEGWQYHTDDDLYKRMYVHATLTDFRDGRSFPESELAYWQAAPQVQAETGVIVLSIPKGGFVVAGKTFVGVICDLGESAGRTIVMNIGDCNFVGGADHKVLCRFSDTVAGIRTGAAEEPFAAFDAEGCANTTHVGTVAAPHRYVGIFVYQEAAEGETPNDEVLKITGISIFSEPEYESGDASVLKGSTVITDGLARATVLLSDDLSQINVAEDDFDIPALVMSNNKTPREMVEAVNAYHDWTTKIDLARRMVFQPRASGALLEFGAWSGEEIEDASAGEGSEIFSRVIAEGTEADGDPLDVSVEDDGNIVSRRGFRRSKAISLQNTTTSGVATDLAEVYLDGQQSVPFAGSIKATVGSVRMVLGGQRVHPSLLGRYTEELLRVSHAIDPDTGGVGRDGRIVAVTYTHATQMAEISLGSRLDNYDALQERLAVIQSVGT